MIAGLGERRCGAAGLLDVAARLQERGAEVPIGTIVVDAQLGAAPIGAVAVLLDVAIATAAASRAVATASTTIPASSAGRSRAKIGA